MLFYSGQGLATDIVFGGKQHSYKVNNHHNQFRGSVQLEADHNVSTCPDVQLYD